LDHTAVFLPSSFYHLGDAASAADEMIRKPSVPTAATGMNNAIYSPSGASAGVGFANPIDVIKKVADALIRDGKIVRPYLGVAYLPSAQAGTLGVKKGILVLEVPEDSPAFKAGMRGTRRTENGLIELGDIITKIEDMEIDTETDLFTALENYKPGDRIRVTVNRLVSSDIASALQGDSLKTKEVVLTVTLKGRASVTAESLKFLQEQGR
jgi:S1-C subfamily serine protease